LNKRSAWAFDHEKNQKNSKSLGLSAVFEELTTFPSPQQERDFE